LKRHCVFRVPKSRSVAEARMELQGSVRSWQVNTSLQEADMGRGLLLWLIGIPIPIILVIWLLGGLHG
jgi:hypothetical protein